MSERVLPVVDIRDAEAVAALPLSDKLAHPDIARSVKLAALDSVLTLSEGDAGVRDESSLPYQCRRFFIVDEATATQMQQATEGTGDVLAPPLVTEGTLAGSYLVPEDIKDSPNPQFQQIAADLAAAGWPVRDLDVDKLWPQDGGQQAEDLQAGVKG